VHSVISVGGGLGGQLLGERGGPAQGRRRFRTLRDIPVGPHLPLPAVSLSQLPAVLQLRGKLFRQPVQKGTSLLQGLRRLVILLQLRVQHADAAVCLSRLEPGGGFRTAGLDQLFVKAHALLQEIAVHLRWPRVLSYRRVIPLVSLVSVRGEPFLRLRNIHLVQGGKDQGQVRLRLLTAGVGIGQGGALGDEGLRFFLQGLILGDESFRFFLLLPADGYVADHQRHNCGQHSSGDENHGGQRRPVAPGELPQPVPRRRRTGLHRLIVQVALHIHREAVGGLVTPVAVLFQRLHHDPVQLAAAEPAQLPRIALPLRRHGCRRLPQRADARARPGRLLLADDAADFVKIRRAQPLLVKRRRAGQQFIQEHAQRIDVAACVHVQRALSGLLRRHV